MKQWNIIGSICTALLVASACSQQPSEATGNATQPKPDTTATAPLEGSRMKVFTLGHPFGGAPSKEWQLYEEFTYDKAAREIEHKTYYAGMTTTTLTTYDADGHEKLKVERSSLKPQGVEFRSSWSADFLTHTVEEYSQKESQVMAKTVKTTDAQGKTLSISTEDLHIPDYPQAHTVRMIYNAAGKLIEERESVANQEIIGVRYAYDAAGNTIEIVRNNAEGKASQIETYAYDAQGRKTTRYFQDLSAFVSSKQLEAKYEYDAAGRLVKELHFGGQCDPNGERSGKCTIVETISMTYDAQGRMLTEVRERAVGDPPVMKKRFEYEGDTEAPVQ